MTAFYYFALVCATQISKRFGLELTALGITYKDKIILSEPELIFTFLKIDKKAVLQAKTKQEIFNVIFSCPYFNPNVFKIRSFESGCIMGLPTEVKSMTISIIKYLRDNKVEPKYKYTTYSEIYDKVVDNFINKYNLTNSVLPITELKKQLSDKLNGNLVMTWFPDMKPGPLLGDMLKQFKEEIEQKCPYDVYLFKNTKETIKNDFMLYFTA